MTREHKINEGEKYIQVEANLRGWPGASIYINAPPTATTRLYGFDRLRYAWRALRGKPIPTAASVIIQNTNIEVPKGSDAIRIVPHNPPVQETMPWWRRLFTR